MAKSVMMVVFVLPSSLRRWVSGRTEVKVFAVGADRHYPPTHGAAPARAATPARPDSRWGFLSKRAVT
jgi:hypothetical protein